MREDIFLTEKEMQELSLEELIAYMELVTIIKENAEKV